MIFLLTILFAAGLPAVAETDCRIENLTDHCEFFRKNSDQKRILVGDKSFHNPLYAEKTPVKEETGEDQQNREDDRILEIQTDLMDSLQPKFGTRFTLALTSDETLDALGKMLSAESLNGKTPKGTLRLPWPPNDPKARSREVGYADFKKDFLNSLTVDQMRLLKLRASEVAGVSFKTGSVRGDRQQKVAPNKEINPAHIVRADELAQQAKDLVLSEISQGRPYETLRGDVKAMYDKIASVKMISPGIAGAENDPSCTAMFATSLYTPPPENKVTICPSLVSLPDASLIQQFAHELGHAIDPCGCTEGIHKVKLPTAAETKSLSPEAETVLEHLRDDVRPQDLPPKEFRIAREQGWVTEIIPGVPFNRYPQATTLNCLNTQIGITPVTREDVRKDFRDEDRFLRAGGETPVEPERKEVIAERRRQALRNPYCLVSENRQNQNREVIADAWSAKVLGRYLEEHPPKSEIEKMAPFAFYLEHQVCDKTKINLPPPAFSTHPFNIERINQIFLADHRVHTSLGCKGNPKNTCLRKLGTMQKPPPDPLRDRPELLRGREGGR